MAFVEVDSDKVELAINEANGKDFQGRQLRVSKATPKERGEAGSSPARERPLDKAAAGRAAVPPHAPQTPAP
ncbi:hypothetical protein GPECTOR_60g769 [Gonium pectorale]|uniref:RRM domain-containing protein n=1 Tax=Gonium pectorale TaxID=33097 RepID=A0A150G6M6_GONPE|nr:hypothetical protein GPECTOR_60g769 [Gonium pectorale]|eukprot:KXZ44990.1 hypothetical protein GPECTOR_60g769 [Gonium pectorale]